MLVVKQRPDDLLLDRFFLVTALDYEQMSRWEVLDHYRERGTAEGHMGELKDVLDPAFAIVARTMYGWRPRGKIVSGESGMISVAAMYTASDLQHEGCAP